MRSMVTRCALAMLMLLPAAAGASAKDLGQPADIYTTRVIVTGTDTRSRPTGIKLCFEDVLVKASGDMKVLDDPRVPALAASAGGLIDRYSYIDRLAGRPVHDEQGTNDRPFYFTCEFNQAKIDAVLAKLGIKPWPGDRTPLTMLLTVQGFGHQNILTADGDFDPDMRIALLNSAMRYGLTVTLPSVNALAANGVTFENAAATAPARLAVIAERSGGALPLVGALDWSDPDHGWIAHWTLTDAKGGLHRWTVKGVSFDEAFRNAVRGSALVLSGGGQS